MSPIEKETFDNLINGMSDEEKERALKILMVWHKKRKKAAENE